MNEELRKKKGIEEMDPLELGRQLKKPKGDLGVLVAEKLNEMNVSLYKLAFSMLSLNDNENLLEIGFGNGKFIKEYFDLNPSVNITGLDFSDEMCKEANEVNRDLIEQGKVKFVCGDALNMPFEAESFDLIIGLNTIYFWSPLESYLSEIIRVLKKGGKLLIGFRPKESMENQACTKEEFCLFEPDEVRNVLQACGFRCIDEKMNWITRKTVDGTEINTADICVLVEKG